MSILVELPERLYQRDAFAAFAAVSPYSLGTARAMAWMSQLAYETAHEEKVGRILASWGMSKRAFKSNDPITGLPPESACVVVAGGLGATIVAFAGSDPLKVEDWITDFTPQLSTTNLHMGFEQAVETVWRDIKDYFRLWPFKY